MAQPRGLQCSLPPGSFTDPKVPKTYSPAGIQAIGAKIWVTYNAIAGGGTGYVDCLQHDRQASVMRLQTWLVQSAMGKLALAPSNFGALSGMILVGNTGSGWIGAYNATTGQFAGFLETSTGTRRSRFPDFGELSSATAVLETGPTNVLYFRGRRARSLRPVSSARSARTENRCGETQRPSSAQPGGPAACLKSLPLPALPN